LSLHKTLELTKPNILLLLGKRNHHLFVNEIDSIDHFIKKINQNSLFIGLQDSIPVLKLVQIHDPILVTDDPLIASNKLVELHQQHYQLGKEKQAVTHLLSKQIDQLITYIAKAELKLEEVINQRDPQELANLIMANLHTIPAKAISATLADFYREGSPPITIKLNPNLSAQLSAQHYYRKSKNKRIELEKIEENITQKKGLLESKKVLLQTAEAIHSLKEIRAFKVNYIDRFKTEAEPLPYHTVMFDGYHILIGKNAKSNDHLTMQIAAKNDLWLHARDVSGSHVIIREKPGQKFPEPVIEKAAQLAAWNSKRKTDSLCPVIYTPRKFVRKIKGAPAGQVVVDKEQVVMVVPTKNAE